MEMELYSEENGVYLPVSRVVMGNFSLEHGSRVLSAEGIIDDDRTGESLPNPKRTTSFVDDLCVLDGERLILLFYCFFFFRFVCLFVFWDLADVVKGMLFRFMNSNPSHCRTVVTKPELLRGE